MATQQRWEDVNHLLLTAQKKQSDTPYMARNPSTFLRDQNVDDRISIDPKLILVLTPFSTEESKTFDVIKRVCNRNGFRCIRGDEEFVPTDILSHVVKLITQARLVIANIGSRNPNVFYELGIAHAFDKQTLLISRTLEHVVGKRILLFSSPEELESILTETLLQIFANAMTQGSPNLLP
jgi:hypothetical protein